ncbi:MAG: type II toxin-antitoxin system Phd/YefM family antitoxin [Actinomycetes bacterium]
MAKSVVGVHEARTHLSQLLMRVARGEEILIARRGQVVARLVSAESSAPRRLGMDVGRLDVPDDFDAPLPDEVLHVFGG